jgi:hypothetical protein
MGGKAGAQGAGQGGVAGGSWRGRQAMGGCRCEAAALRCTCAGEAGALPLLEAKVPVGPSQPRKATSNSQLRT